MKKTYNQIIFIIAVLVMSSCSTTTPLTPSDVKLMTTKQYETDYETVYKSVMSLLQSEQFTIEQTDYQTGLITATKNIYDKKRAFLTKGVVIVDKLNSNLTEVKVTMYYGEEKIKTDGYSDRKRRTERMIEAPDFYHNWFNNLYTEIERRKALM